MGAQAGVQDIPDPKRAVCAHPLDGAAISRSGLDRRRRRAMLLTVPSATSLYAHHGTADMAHRLYSGVQKTADSAVFAPANFLEEDVTITGSGPADNGSGPASLDEAPEQLKQEHATGFP